MTESSNVCDDNGNSIEAGIQTVCRITAIQAFNKGPVTEPSYARALRAEIESSSGEKVLGTINYFAEGEFLVNFTLTRVGKARITIKYARDNGYAVLDSSQTIEVYAGQISADHSKVQCIRGSSVAEPTQCIILGYDMYGNEAGDTNFKGAFRLGATREGYALTSSTMDAIQTNAMKFNEFKIAIDIRISGAWTITGIYRESQFCMRLE